MDFYKNILCQLADNKTLLASDKILVVAGGPYDRESFLAISAENVVISNLEPHNGHTDYSPYRWERLDAELIGKPDNSYDWVFVHAGLHHLSVPAKGVCEMFRVASKGILCIEARDTLLMRLAVVLGITSDYELETAFLSDGMTGGYRNGTIPNYVYRWTEREFEKVINSFAPSHTHSFFYHYGYSVPLRRFNMARNPLYRATGLILSYMTDVAKLIAPRQGNLFAFAALKNVTLQPWLEEDLTFKKSYLGNKYDKDKY